MIQMKRPVYIAPVQPDEQKYQHLVWLASYPKSGNTWVRMFLHNLVALKADPASKPIDINGVQEQTLWELKPQDYERLLGSSVEEASTLDIARVRAQVQFRIARAQEGPAVIKTHNAHAAYSGHPMINIDATLAAIYVVRNPLDLAISYAHHSDESVDVVISNMAQEDMTSQPSEKNVFEFLGSWSFHVSSWLSIHTRPVLLVRYEDLLDNPRASFARVAAFLKIEADQDLIDKAIAASSFDELSRQEQLSGFYERVPSCKQFFRAGKRGQWQSGLSRAQINSVVRSHAPMMMRMGYLPPTCGRSVSVGKSGDNL